MLERLLRLLFGQISENWRLLRSSLQVIVILGIINFIAFELKSSLIFALICLTSAILLIISVIPLIFGVMRVIFGIQLCNQRNEVLWR